MIDIYELFSFDKRTLTFSINAGMLAQLPQFESVWSRKVKELKFDDYNKEEMKYIFFVAEDRNKNPLHGFGLEERKLKAKSFAGLPETWIEDTITLAAINMYQEYLNKLCPSLRLLKSAKINLTQTALYFEIQATTISSLQIALNNASSELATATGADLTSKIQNFNSVAESVSNIITASSKIIPTIAKQLKEISDLEASVKKEEEAAKIKSGGGIIGRLETPSTSLLNRIKDSSAND